ncbi:hypothetical protein NKG05_15430 [Oerskovia sp. M15]
MTPSTTRSSPTAGAPDGLGACPARGVRHRPRGGSGKDCGRGGPGGGRLGAGRFGRRRRGRAAAAPAGGCPAARHRPVDAGRSRRVGGPRPRPGGGHRRQCRPGHAALTSDAEHALLTGEPGTAVRLLAAAVGIELPVSGDEPGDTSVHADVQVRSKCIAAVAYVSARVVNEDGSSVDARVTTPFGSKSFAGILPGKSANFQASSRSTSIPGGTVKVALSTPDGRSTVTDLPYEALSCG